MLFLSIQAVVKNITNWVVDKQLKFIPNISGLRSQRSSHQWIQWSGESQFPHSHLFCVCPHTAKGARNLSAASFIKAPTNLIHEALASWPNHLPKVPPQSTTTLDIRISTYELRGRGQHEHSDNSKQFTMITKPYKLWLL